ncbi:hypothetical protein AHAS_Ahas16G0286100 [Arachis hypogaea]
MFFSNACFLSLIYLTGVNFRLIVGNLHGDLKLARSALEMAGVLSSDDQDLWTGGKTVNGNHETMNLEGGFRYVDSGAFDECNDFLEYVNDSEDGWEETVTGWVYVFERWKNNEQCPIVTGVNGNEIASISLLTWQNEFWILESFPCLHDKVLQAAVDVIVSQSPSQNERQGITSIFANFVKNFTTGKADPNANQPAHPNILENLEQIFSNPPFLKPSSDTVDPLDDFELDLGIGSMVVTIVKQGSNLFIGYIGDSRAVMGSKDSNDSMVAIQLTIDLKPDLQSLLFASEFILSLCSMCDFCIRIHPYALMSNEEVVEIVSSAPTRSSAAKILVDAAARE